MGDEVEDGLVLGPEVASVEQLIECDGLHLGSWTPFPQQTPLEVLSRSDPLFFFGIAKW
jgi:hypothetical protein